MIELREILRKLEEAKALAEAADHQLLVYLITTAIDETTERLRLLEQPGRIN